MGEYLLLTLAAQAATLPLMAWHFHQISLTSVIANPLILPAQPLIMMLGAVALLAGMVFLPLGQILGWFVLPLLSYTTGVVEWLARLPGSIQITGSSLVWIFILLAAAALILLIGKRFPDQLKPAILLTASGMAAVVIWMAVAMRPDGNLHITLLALDEGHAVLIRTPHGQTYLLNGSCLRAQPGCGFRPPVVSLRPGSRRINPYRTAEHRYQRVEFPGGANGCEAGSMGSECAGKCHHPPPGESASPGRNIEPGTGRRPGFPA